ncbi:MAG: hypothetical protein PVH29_03435 [Candidatus Zixiibacteriota bacterium]|jgi:hypothetical protein
MKKRIMITIIVLAAGFAAGAAYAADNVVENGDFESGNASPWVTTNMGISADGARTGSYGAYFYELISGDSCGRPGAPGFDAEQAVWGEITQNFGREITAGAVTRVGMWVYYLPDTEGNPWFLTVSLGSNEILLSSERGELVKGWNYVTFPAEKITRPFSDLSVQPSLRTG